MDYAKESLRLHGEWGGKIEVVCTVPCKTKEDLSLAYTPGVAQPCLEIQKDVNKSYELTRRHNLCAVITDGTAVLGLGDIGPEAGMPVMEGKCPSEQSRHCPHSESRCLQTRVHESAVTESCHIRSPYAPWRCSSVQSRSFLFRRFQ